MAAEQPVLTRIEGAVGIATLNRPDKFNCVSSGLVEGLDAARAAFEADRSVRVMLIAANGRHFCTGADLDEVLAAREDKAALAAFIERGHAMLQRLEASDLPVVGAVHGLCLAGGLEIAMACDVVIAAASARLGDQHAQFGLIPGWGGTQRLPRLVGLRRALDLMFSARWLDADAARDWGLVNEVVPDDELAGKALAYAGGLAKRSPDGLAAMKRLARTGLDGPLADGLRLEADCIVDALRSANVSEGLTAFRERREPSFG